MCVFDENTDLINHTGSSLCSTYEALEKAGLLGALKQWKQLFRNHLISEWPISWSQSFLKWQMSKMKSMLEWMTCNHCYLSSYCLLLQKDVYTKYFIQSAKKHLDTDRRQLKSFRWPNILLYTDAYLSFNTTEKQLSENKRLAICRWGELTRYR